MSSTLFVDAIEPNLSSGVHIAGHVIQTESFISDNYIDITSVNTFVDVGISCAFTPRFSNSKLQLVFSGAGLMKNAGATGGACAIRLKRSGAVVWSEDWYGYTDLTNAWVPMNYSFHFIDTPNTTSLVTYTVELARTSGGNIRISQLANATGGAARATLMEIAQ